MKIPENYQAVMPYLILEGAEQFSRFMQAVFDAKETHRTMRSDGTIMHAEVMTGGSTIMFAESGEQWGVNTAGLFIYVDDADARYKKALDNGAAVITPVADQDYGRSGGVKDPFGNTWWITSLNA